MNSLAIWLAASKKLMLIPSYPWTLISIASTSKPVIWFIYQPLASRMSYSIRCTWFCRYLCWFSCRTPLLAIIRLVSRSQISWNGALWDSCVGVQRSTLQSSCFMASLRQISACICSSLSFYTNYAVLSSLLEDCFPSLLSVSLSFKGPLAAYLSMIQGSKAARYFLK
jgi:hypothetical protein